MFHRHESNSFHNHAHSDVPHNHMLRALCGFPECAEYPTHNIHKRYATDVSVIEPIDRLISGSAAAGWTDELRELSREFWKLAFSHTGDEARREGVTLAMFTALEKFARKQEADSFLDQLIQIRINRD